jgi:hypothetical protein
MAKKKVTPTFLVRFVAPHISPETVRLRMMTDALAAVQDLACGRDPFATPHVPEEKTIGLFEIHRQSS